MSDISDKNGFTLIELLIVVAIIGILAAIAIPNFVNAQLRATIARIQGDHKAIATAAEMYAADNGVYPHPELASDEDGNVTTWPYYVSNQFVEPVSYLSNEKLFDPLGRPLEGLPRLVSRYRFKVFPVQTRSDLPGANAEGNREALKVHGSYMVASHGPNRWLDLPNGFADGANKTDWFWLPFDATNGLRSPGDILRGQGQQVSGYPGYNITWRVSAPRSPF